MQKDEIVLCSRCKRAIVATQRKKQPPQAVVEQYREISAAQPPGEKYVLGVITEWQRERARRWPHLYFVPTPEAVAAEMEAWRVKEEERRRKIREGIARSLLRRKKKRSPSVERALARHTA